MPADSHITVNGQPLTVFQDKEKVAEIEEVRQDEIAANSFRRPIRTSAVFDARPKRRNADVSLRQIAQIQLLLEREDAGVLYSDLRHALGDLDGPTLSTLTTRMGCIKWKIPKPGGNGMQHALTMVRLRRADEAIPEIKRRKKRVAAVAMPDAAQPAPESPITLPAIPKAPPELKPLVGSLRHELVAFARAQRRLEKLRLHYLEKVAKLDRIHMRNWHKFGHRLLEVAPSSPGDNGKIATVDHHATRPPLGGKLAI